jgi:hypothetical protein
MAYKVSILFSNSKVTKSSKLSKFIEDCRNNINNDDKIKNKLSKINNEIFCYEIDGKIAISRKIFEELSTGATFKSVFSNKSIKPLIQKLVGYDEIVDSDYWDLIENKSKIATKLKQDFTCFVASYFFNNSAADHYTLLDILKQKNLKIDEKVSLSSDLDNFDIFLYKENYLKFFDSVATAKTIVFNKSKLNIKHPLTSYVVAEEESPLGSKIKSIPFFKIKLTEKNYYTDENKMTTADIYLCNTSSTEFKTLLKVFNRKTLTHEQYRSFVNSAYKSGDLIPISLKELRTQDVDNNFVTNRVKVLNFISESEDIQDTFLKKVIELLGISNKTKFIEEMNKVIDIKNESINLNPYGTRTTFNFDAYFNETKGKEEYDVFIQGNQLYIKPPGSSSDAGLGGVTMEYLKEQILNKLPDRGKYNRVISNARKKSFGNFYKNTQDLTQAVYGSLKNKDVKELGNLILKYKILHRNQVAKKSKKELIELVEGIRAFKKYKNYNLLATAKILSPSEFSTVFKDIPESLRVPIASAYIQELYSQLSKVPKVDTTLSGEFRSKTYGKEQLIMNKLSDIEILFFLACNYNIVKKWIKNSFILGAYGIASGAGIILLDGKKHTLGKGKSGILRRNPVFVKIGL